MTVIYHQLKNETFYFPNWKVDQLFIGTFNPEGGDKVNYYYGRQKNQTWKLLSEIFCSDLNPNSETFFELLKKHRIACVDLIDHLIVEESRVDRIIGKGYKDSEIINGSVKLEYNTNKIQEVIKVNKGIHVYSTWGKGSNFKEWKEEVEKLGSINSLVSPSLAARVPKGKKKFDYMLADWKKKIKNGGLHCI